jgi:nicotinate-nucleotide adenylyltransferase
MNNRIGILGGTFNPIHNGHVDLGSRILAAFNLEKVLYILSAKPPHKPHQEIAPVGLRWEMLNKALESFPSLEPCPIEMERPGLSWTVDTVNVLRPQNPGAQLFFISGSEGFLKIRTWKDYRTLTKAISFIVVLRKRGHRQRVIELLKEEGIPGCDEADQGQQVTWPCADLFSYESDQLPVSSTMIRERIKSGRPIDSFLDKRIIKIIEEYGLYGYRRV